LRVQRELTYGLYGLAVLELDRGNLPEAQRGFFAQRAALEEMLAANPGDLQLRVSLADVASWLGTIAERSGSYAEAIARFTEMSSRSEELVRLEPAVARWRLKLADGIAFTGDVRAVTGRQAEALADYLRAQALRGALVAQDPKNRQWHQAELNGQLHHLALLLARDDAASVAAQLDEARVHLEALVKAEPSSLPFTAALAMAWRLEGCLRLATQRADADKAVARAIDLGAALVNEGRADNKAIGEFAQSCILAGRIALAQGRPEVARSHWTRALEAVAPHLADSNDWRFLDPAAQALVLLGRADEAEPLIARLRHFGYHPLDPLAVPILDAAIPTVSSTKNN